MYALVPAVSFIFIILVFIYAYKVERIQNGKLNVSQRSIGKIYKQYALILLGCSATGALRFFMEMEDKKAPLFAFFSVAAFVASIAFFKKARSNQKKHIQF